jgi:hypothetical protein
MRSIRQNSPFTTTLRDKLTYEGINEGFTYEVKWVTALLSMRA